MSACGGGGGDSVLPPLPDLSGVWAGTWQGADPAAGSVSGTWEAVLTQGDTSVAGTATLLGDVDCMDGVVAGGVENDVVRGTFDRSPCKLNTWTMTAIDVDANVAAGVWEQPEAGASGAMTGMRIAVPGGPRVLYANPPSGKAGAIVTLVGSGFGASAADNMVGFGVASATPLAADPSTLVVSVPGGATLGPVSVTAPSGVALTPRAFDPAPRSPAMIAGGSVLTGYLQAQGIVFGPDGRKLYVAIRASGPAPARVAVVDPIRRQMLFTPEFASPAEPTALVASPDGKRVYLAAGPAGVLVLDAALGNLLDTIALQGAASPTLDNPQGIALSPDGRRLYVTDARAAGSLSIVTLATKSVISIAMGAEEIPLGVAVHPRGDRLFVAVADASQAGNDAVRVLDATSGQQLDILPTGARPTGLAVTPDGARLYATNQAGDSVSVFNAVNGTLLATLTPGSAPTGIAATPDGTRVMITLKGEGSVSAWAVDGGETGRLPLGAVSPLGVAIAPNGGSAFAASPDLPAILEIGGSQTLTVSKTGTGIGTITSSPAGIDCGTACVASFDTGSVVTLSAFPAAGSVFNGWTGDADCGDGVVTMSASVSCNASFVAVEPPSPTPVPGGCFIATAAWGSPMAAEVDSLRRFRDRVLMHSALGRAFVQAYYAVSPPIADFIRERESLRAATRVALWPVVQAVRHPAEAAGLALLALAAPLFGLRGRRGKV